MPAVFTILIQSLLKEYTILRDIYIFIEEATWLTNLALENDDTDEIAVLIEQRQEYSATVKEREQRIRDTEEMLKNILGWDHFSIVRLITEKDEPPIIELGKIYTEIHNIICSLARIDMINYHIQQGKCDKDKARKRMEIVRRIAEEAYCDIPFKRYSKG